MTAGIIDLPTLEEDVLDNASYFGRIFARSGGLSDAVAEALKEQGSEFHRQGHALRRHRGLPHGAAQGQPKDVLKDVNFIEGMACVGGCIGGAGCLTHGPKDKGEVDKYGHEAIRKDHHRRAGPVRLRYGEINPAGGAFAPLGAGVCGFWRQARRRTVSTR